MDFEHVLNWRNQKVDRNDSELIHLVVLLLGRIWLSRKDIDSGIILTGIGSSYKQAIWQANLNIASYISDYVFSFQAFESYWHPMTYHQAVSVREFDAKTQRPTFRHD